MHCTGTYSSIDDSARGIQCQSPVRPGILMLRGDVIGWKAQSFDLGVTAEQVPLDRLVALARHTKKDLPEDLTATGSTDVVISVRRSPGEMPLWSGGGRTTRFTLVSRALKPDLDLGPLEYAIAETPNLLGPKGQRRHAKSANLPAVGPSPHVVVKPFAFPLGSSSPAVAKAYFDLAQYKFDLAGAAELCAVAEHRSRDGYQRARNWSGWPSPDRFQHRWHLDRVCRPSTIRQDAVPRHYRPVARRV